MIFIYILIIFYSVSRYFDVSFMGLTSEHQWYQLLTYNVIHLSFYHLIVNSIGIIMYKSVLIRSFGYIRTLITVLISVLIPSFMFAANKPTYGASSIVFSMIGMFLYLIWSKGYAGRLKYTFMLLIIILTQCIAGNSVMNWQIHISSMLLAYFLSYVFRLHTNNRREQKEA